MTRTVLCRKYQQELPGLDRPPYPGPMGQDIYEHVSKKAWDEWQAHQTMLINEKRLNMMNAADRKFLQQELKNFLDNQQGTQIESYQAPTDK